MMKRILLALTFVAALGAASVGVSDKAQAQPGCFGPPYGGFGYGAGYGIVGTGGGYANAAFYRGAYGPVFAPVVPVVPSYGVGPYYPGIYGGSIAVPGRGYYRRGGGVSFSVRF
jgi:hypothetical protein